MSDDARDDEMLVELTIHERTERELERLMRAKWGTDNIPRDIAISYCARTVLADIREMRDDDVEVDRPGDAE